MDDLLDSYLETGDIPADATAEERIELARMANAVGILKSSRPAVEREALAAQPVSKARFERFLAASQGARAHAPIQVQAVARRQSWLVRLLQVNRGVGAVGVASVIGVVAFIAVFIAQNASHETETAAAQVLTPGDYAQVYGTVSSITGSGEDTTLVVDSEFGQLHIAVSDATSVVEADTLRELASIRPGERLLIAGLVQENRTIAARTLALAGGDAIPLVAGIAAARDLKRTPPLEFDGRVTLITLARDGVGARLVVAVADGTRYTVRIDRRSAGALLVRDRVIGELVHLVHREGDATNLYVVQVRAAPPAAVSPTPSTPAAGRTPTKVASPPSPSPAAAATRLATGFVNASGVITGRVANVVTIQTDSGLLSVVIRADTQVILGESGLTLADVLRGETVVGHSVSVQGGIERITGRVIADVIIVRPRP
jgi:hypothetical protein